MPRVIVLGSTGSIGTQTLDVVRHLNALDDSGREPFEVVGLAAGCNAALLAEQARRFGVRHLALANEDAPLDAPGSKAFRGESAAEQLVRTVDADIVVAAMVGMAGLPATLAAIDRGSVIALANKETLVAAGALVMNRLHASKGRSSLLPVDSEHAALWQCLLHAGPHAGHGPSSLPTTERVKRAILTASGGPFRTWTKADIDAASPTQALRHPTWTMGRKVTIDSASFMNKALEVIEAHWLFGLRAEQIEVLVHPQSIVHAMAEFIDGSTVAQLAPPDMRLPIQRALTWPACAPAISQGLDWTTLRSLEFERPDLERFPALGLAYWAIAAGGSAGATLNAANEEAVEAFLDADGRMPFGEITRLVTEVTQRTTITRIHTLEDVLEADAAARARTIELLGRALRR